MERPSKAFRVSSIILDVKKNVKKRVHGNDKKNLPSDSKKCPGLLHFTLLSGLGNKLTLITYVRKTEFYQFS